MPTSTAPPLATASAAVAATSPAAVSAGIPRGRAESQFQMHLLDSELQSAKSAHPSDPATLAGIDFQAKAQAAFDTGAYPDAFRFALKGRRGLGGHVEAVAPGPATHAAPAVSAPIDPDRAAEVAAGAARCPNCGYPTNPDDAFCRGCGTPRAPSTCPRCGTARTPSDTFCGRCGERFS